MKKEIIIGIIIWVLLSTVIVQYNVMDVYKFMSYTCLEILND